MAMKYTSIPDIDHWYEMIASFKQGELSEQEEKQLFVWKNEKAEHAAFFEETVNSWEQSREKIQFPEFDTIKAWDKIKAQTVAKTPIAQASKKETLLQQWNAVPFFRAAAAVLLLIVVSWAMSQFLFTKPVYTDLTAGAGVREYYLPDSSKVWLHDTTTIRYSSEYGKEERMVYLDGEAFFEVRKNPSKPFTVLSYRSRVIVKGTSFLVRSRKKESLDIVEVEEGRVAVLEKYSRSGEELILTKGMTASVDIYGGLKKSEYLKENIAAWRRNKLMFDGTPLKVVIKDLKTFTNINVVLEDKQSRDCRFTGEFDNNTPEEIMEVLALSMNMEFVKEGDTFILKGKACK